MNTTDSSFLKTGTFLSGGTYKIEKVLGQGSFGTTYLAEHTGLKRKVAIKEFFMKELNSRGDDGSITGMTDGSLSHSYCAKFRKEAVNLSRLDHPNIVRVTDSFSENGTFYYVMEYIEGQNLNDYVKTHHVDEKEAVSIIKYVTDALIYMHESQHMLHLDLKPGNVMRRESDGHIFLIDFGLSKHFCEDGQPETSTTIGLGTPGYAPIEQGNRAKNGEFRPTIDVYALGATFYKLLTGETPPAASDLVSDDELLEGNLRAKGVSENLVGIVSQSMNPNTAKRFQSIREFQNAIRGYINVINNACQVKKKCQTDVQTDNNHSTKIENIKNIAATINSNTLPKHNNAKAIIITSSIVFALIAVIYVFTFKKNANKVSNNAVDYATDSIAVDLTTESTDTAVVTKSSNTQSPKQKAPKNIPNKKRTNNSSRKDDTKENALVLKKAISSGNYQIVQQLANEGYAAAYGPLARYYLQNNEYTLAESYAKKAKMAGFNEGRTIIKTLEDLGYYD